MFSCILDMVAVGEKWRFSQGLCRGCKILIVFYERYYWDGGLFFRIIFRNLLFGIIAFVPIILFYVVIIGINSIFVYSSLLCLLFIYNLRNLALCIFTCGSRTKSFVFHGILES